jgi:glycosyltransferase involved in cell wall biosynthesis
MVLGVNGIRLVRDRSGVARMIEAVLNTLAEIEQPFTEVRLYAPMPIPAEVRLPAIVRPIVLRSALPPSLWEQIVLPAAHPRRYPLLCPSYVLPLLARCPTLLVHHGSYEGFADAAHSYSWWRRFKARVSYAASARRASMVSTVSEYSRRDMVRFYGLPDDRIHVIPDGVDTRLFRPLSDAALLSAWRRRVLGDDVPFLLYVGKPTRRRNLPQLLEAYARLRRDRALPHKLLLIGTALPGTSLNGTIRSLGLQNDVVSVPHAPHAEVALAYNAASLMIYPSSYEGFGMPVLEAMACGTPVIALNNTAFPEFAGGVALLLPDARIDTLADGIAGLLDDDARRRQMAADGPRRAAAYDWRIVTQQYVDLLARLAV